ncbi:AraC family transcriptional regulator [Terribacillus saccharophilus]|uniref:helix-turn-helix domain-containing protein n=1 Tax=Terribacillus saccharophilus TaxID=361277 RepID=UPI003981EA31
MERFIYKKTAGITALSASMKEFTYKKHSHREYALGVTLRGIQKFNLDGHNQLSYPSGVMLFNPEQTHDGMAYGESNLEYVMLYIDPVLLLETTRQHDLIRFDQPIVYDDILKRKVVTLSHAITSGQDEAFCSELLVSLADSLSQKNADTTYRRDTALIGKAKDMMHASLQGVLKLDDICLELGMSKYKFIRLFKAHTGSSPYQYFLNGKLEYAKQIIERNRDIYAAVAACGFVDLAHLNRHFKGVYGITAYEYMLYLR